MSIEKPDSDEIKKYMSQANFEAMDPYVRKKVVVRGKPFGVPVKRADGREIGPAGMMAIQVGIANLLHFAEMNPDKDSLLEKCHATAFGTRIIKPQDKRPGGNLYKEKYPLSEEG